MVRISIVNSTARDLDWVRLDWDGPFVPGGVMSKGISKTAVDVALPLGETAKLMFVDDETRVPFEIEFSLDALKVLPSSIREVEIQILDHESVEMAVVRN